MYFCVEEERERVRSIGWGRPEWGDYFTHTTHSGHPHPHRWWSSERISRNSRSAGRRRKMMRRLGENCPQKGANRNHNNNNETVPWRESWKFHKSNQYNCFSLTHFPAGYWYMKRIDGLDGLQLPSKHEKKDFRTEVDSCIGVVCSFTDFFFFFDFSLYFYLQSAACVLSICKVRKPCSLSDTQILTLGLPCPRLSVICIWRWLRHEPFHEYSFTLIRTHFTSVTFPMTFCPPTGACKKSKMTDKIYIHIQISCPTAPSRLTNGLHLDLVNGFGLKKRPIANSKAKLLQCAVQIERKKQWELIWKKKKINSSYHCAKLIQFALRLILKGYV